MTGQIHYADGIKFPASQVASSDVNTLDDYEEGSIEVAFACGTSGTITIYSEAKLLYYTKIGRVVHFQGYLIVASVSSPVGALYIQSLPFAAAANIYSPVTVRAAGLESTAATMMQGYVVQGSTNIIIEHFAAGVAANAAADCKASSEFIVGGTYYV